MGIKGDYIVELEFGIYLADGDGNPSRTLDRMYAARFETVKNAKDALDCAREYLLFPRADIHT